MIEERKYKILNIVNSKGYITNHELCKILNSSLSTVQRDLSDLSKRGLLVKVWSGAKSLNILEKESNVGNINQSEENISTRSLICQYAASLIDDNEFIYIDNSLIAFNIIDFLSKKNVVVVSNSYSVINKANGLNLTGIIVGGAVDVETKSTYGVIAQDCLSLFNFTKCFLSADKISLDGIFTKSINDAEIKQKAILLSEQTYILADNTKFSQTGFYKIVDLDNVKVITSKPVPQKILAFSNEIILID